MAAGTTSTVSSSVQEKQCQLGWRWLARLAAAHLDESSLEVGIPVLRGLAGRVVELHACTVAQVGVGHPELVDHLHQGFPQRLYGQGIKSTACNRAKPAQIRAAHCVH